MRKRETSDAHSNGLSPRFAGSSVLADDPEVPLRSTPGFMLSPRFAGLRQKFQINRIESMKSVPLSFRGTLNSQTG